MTLEELIKAIDDDCDCHGWADDLKALPTPAAGPWIPVGAGQPPPWNLPKKAGQYMVRATDGEIAIGWIEPTEGISMWITHWAEIRRPK